jgi:hypothetical protein
MGNSDMLVIWFTDTVPGTPKASQSLEALAVMDEWVRNIAANPTAGIRANRPARAVDSCFDVNGRGKLGHQASLLEISRRGLPQPDDRLQFVVTGDDVTATVPIEIDDVNVRDPRFVWGAVADGAGGESGGAIHDWSLRQPDWSDRGWSAPAARYRQEPEDG